MTKAHSVSRRSFVAGTGALALLGAFGLSGCSTLDERPKKSTDLTYDAVIVGCGGAGMSAAIAAYDKGLTNIVILEKMKVVGGNTNFSSSGMNASETKFQAEQGIQDSNDLFAQETLVGGHNTGNPELVHYMCDHSAATIDWLDGLGITLNNLTTTGGMSVKRCHRPTDGSAVGATLVPGLYKQVKERNIPIKMRMDVKEILTDDSGAVTGVRAEDYLGDSFNYHAKAVVLASGGLGSNKELITKYRPDLASFTSTNQPGATGDGYLMAEAVGAELLQMDQIQIHPTVGYVENAPEGMPAPLIGETVRGTGAILVNKNGERFFDEMSTRDKVSAAELAQPDVIVWEVFDQQVYDANKAIRTTYEPKGLVKDATSLDDLAGKIGVDAATLRATVDTYNAVTTSGAADPFGRTKGMIAFKDGNFYAIRVNPGIHHEMGGVRINVNNEALNANGDVIPGLYAAGEVTGGIHGNNRIGGNAVCDITTFGRNVGERIANSLQ